MPRSEVQLRFESVEAAGDWNDVPAAAILDDLAAAVTQRLPDAGGTVSVALADDDFIHDLNRRFRGIDRPTNVLSFPAGEGPDAAGHLGDIALSVDTLRREAAAEGRPLHHHFAHLALHGLLHLLGYDHDSDEEAAAMEGLESALLAELGIPDPYGRERAALNET